MRRLSTVETASAGVHTHRQLPSALDGGSNTETWMARARLQAASAADYTRRQRLLEPGRLWHAIACWKAQRADTAKIDHVADQINMDCF